MNESVEQLISTWIEHAGTADTDIPFAADSEIVVPKIAEQVATSLLIHGLLRTEAKDELAVKRRIDQVLTAIDSTSPRAIVVPARWRRAWGALYDIASDYITLSLLIATIVMTIIVLSLALIVLDPSEHAPSIETPSIEFVANITDTDRTVWDESSDGNLKNRSLFAGDALILTSGLAEVTFDDGAVVLLEGPVSFVVDSASSGSLEQGKLVAKVPPPATGFVIDAPSISIVDLGTEFGVDVSDKDSTDVHVFVGKVAIVSLDSNGDRLAKTVLSSSQSLVFKGGVPLADTPTVASDKKFTRVLHNSDLPDLVGHWKLDDQAENGVVYAEVGSDGTFTRNTREASVEGHTGSALVFGQQNLVNIDAPRTLLALSEFTVTAWVRNYDGGESNVVLAWSDGTLDSRMQCELHQESMVSYFGGAGERVDRGDKLAWSPNQWYHVAWSQSATGEMRMYRDGRLVGGPFLNRPAPNTMRLNRVGIGSLHGRADHMFSGDIDDIQVYGRALVPGEVAALVQNAGAALGDVENK